MNPAENEEQLNEWFSQMADDNRDAFLQLQQWFDPWLKDHLSTTTRSELVAADVTRTFWQEIWNERDLFFEIDFSKESWLRFKLMRYTIPLKTYNLRPALQTRMMLNNTLMEFTDREYTDHIPAPLTYEKLREWMPLAAGTLSEQHQAVYELRYTKKWSYPDIAVKLELTVEDTIQTYNDAIQMIRSYIVQNLKSSSER